MSLLGGLDFGGKQFTLASLDTDSSHFSNEFVDELPKGAEDPWNKLVPSTEVGDRSAIDELRDLEHRPALFFLKREYKQILQNLGIHYSAIGICLPYASSPMIRAVVRQGLLSVSDRRVGSSRSGISLSCWESPIAAAAGDLQSGRYETATPQQLMVVSSGENAVEWTQLEVAPERIVVRSFLETSFDPPSQALAMLSGVDPVTRWIIDERLPPSTRVAADRLRKIQPGDTAVPFAVLAARGAAWLTARAGEETDSVAIDRVFARSLGLLIRNRERQVYWMTLADRGQRQPRGDWDRLVRCVNSGEPNLNIAVVCWADGVPPGDWVRAERWRSHVRWWQPTTPIRSTTDLSPARLSLSARETAHGWQFEAAAPKVALSG